MALNKTALKEGIVQLHTDMSAREENSIEEYAERLSDLIDAYVKTGTVQPGITVSVTGGSGVTTSTGNIQ
ncbi:MAG: hypothetical protein JWP81_5 [Ferruginibacter sp.]|nr:hypothetical protein [Ferruginibacter sp.]